MPLPSGQLAILEAKHFTPHAGDLGRSFEETFEAIESKADIISVLVDPRWRGSLAHLRWARATTRKPLLAKAMATTDKQIAEAFDDGADYALAYDFVPRVRPERCLVEPAHLGRLAALQAQLYVWNARDLENRGQPKPETAGEAAARHFGQWWCQASFIRTPADVHPEAGAALVGTHSIEFAHHLPDAPVLPPELWP